MRKHGRLLLLMATLLAALLVPSASQAATVTAYVVAPPPDCVGKCGGPPPPFSVVALDARAGEANDVSWRDEGTTFTAHDAGAPLAASTGCTAVDEHTATCTLPSGAPAAKPAIALDDGDDRFTALSAARPATVSGGPGNDDLRGSD